MNQTVAVERIQRIIVRYTTVRSSPRWALGYVWTQTRLGETGKYCDRPTHDKLWWDCIDRRTLANDEWASNNSRILHRTVDNERYSNTAAISLITASCDWCLLVIVMLLRLHCAFYEFCIALGGTLERFFPAVCLLLTDIIRRLIGRTKSKSCLAS